MISQINRILNEWKRITHFSFFFLFIFTDYFAFFSSIFDFFAVILSFIQVPIKIFLSLLLLLLNHLSLFITFFLFVILFFLLLSLCLVLFHSFRHLSSQTFLFHSFEISSHSDIVVFRFTFAILRFPFLKVVISFVLYSIILKHAAILRERFGQTCMIKEQSEMLML